MPCSFWSVSGRHRHLPGVIAKVGPRVPLLHSLLSQPCAQTQRPTQPKYFCSRRSPDATARLSVSLYEILQTPCRAAASPLSALCDGLGFEHKEDSDGSTTVPQGADATPIQPQSGAPAKCSFTIAYKLSTEKVKSSGPESIGPERPLSGLPAPGPVHSPFRITLENNGKTQPQPDGENSSVRANGGGGGIRTHGTVPRSLS
jgi:hypothetical protein